MDFKIKDLIIVSLQIVEPILLLKIQEHTTHSKRLHLSLIKANKIKVQCLDNNRQEGILIHFKLDHKLGKIVLEKI